MHCKKNNYEEKKIAHFFYRCEDFFLTKYIEKALYYIKAKKL